MASDPGSSYMPATDGGTSLRTQKSSSQSTNSTIRTGDLNGISSVPGHSSMPKTDDGTSLNPHTEFISHSHNTTCNNTDSQNGQTRTCDTDDNSIRTGLLSGVASIAEFDTPHLSGTVHTQRNVLSETNTPGYAHMSDVSGLRDARCDTDDDSIRTGLLSGLASITEFDTHDQSTIVDTQRNVLSESNLPGSDRTSQLCGLRGSQCDTDKITVQTTSDVSGLQDAQCDTDDNSIWTGFLSGLASITEFDTPDQSTIVDTHFQTLIAWYRDKTNDYDN